jgi:hypothetical protein
MPNRKHPILIAALAAIPFQAGAAPDFRFDSSISRPVLENYLDRSISFTELLHDDLSEPRNARGVDPRDNIRFLIGAKAKFIGRALLLWGGERNLATFLARAKPYIDTLHRLDPEMVLQGGAFEIVTQGVEAVPVPAHVFAAFGQPAAQRAFRYADMLYADGRQVDHWGAGASVPDMSRLETRMWFYYLASAYIDAGLEAIHFGQVGLMDWNDKGHAGWIEMLTKAREYARAHARRHFLICDAHAPTGGFVENGKLLFDFHSFPLRIAEVTGKPVQGELKVGHTDAIFLKSKGGIAPSGWSCAHLPYLVEFDNFGSNGNVGKPGNTPFIWGWDEITWWALRPAAERRDWLRYAWRWVDGTDPEGHLEMPGSRVMTPGSAGGPDWYWVNDSSAACPKGFGDEAVIRELWGTATSLRPPYAARSRDPDAPRWVRPDGRAVPGLVRFRRGLVKSARNAAEP